MAKEDQNRVPPRKSPSPQQPRSAAGEQPLSPAERIRREDAAQRARQHRRELAYRRAQRRRWRLRLCAVSLLLSLGFVFLYWIWVGISIFTRADGSEEALPLLVYTEGENKRDARYDPKDSFRNGTYYLPVTFLRDYMAVSLFGDGETSSFLLCDSGDWATFHPGTSRAVINGKDVSLRADALLLDGVLYLPLDFYLEKMNCFTFAESVPLEAKVLTFRIDLAPSLLLQKETAVEPIAYPG